MSDGADAVSVLRWGLRRYLLLVLLCVTLGSLAPLALDDAEDSYEARAQVGPESRLLLPNLDPLPRVGQSVFDNGAVAEAVRLSVEPPLSRSMDVVPEVVELVAAQDNVVFTVVGHSGNAETARHVANVAARAFALELNKYADSVGSFRVQQLAATPSGPAPGANGVLFTIVGPATGLVLGLGLVVLLLVVRQPVIDLPTAERLTGGRGLSRIRLSPSEGGTRGLPSLSRAILSGNADMVLMTGPRNARRDRVRLADLLTGLLSESRTVLRPGATREMNRVRLHPEVRGGRRTLVVILDPSELELATRPNGAVVMLVVREGISTSSLLKQAEQYGAGVTIVLVKRRFGLRRRRTLPAADPSPGAAEDPLPDVVSAERRSRV